MVILAMAKGGFDSNLTVVKINTQIQRTIADIQILPQNSLISQVEVSIIFFR